MRSTAKSSARRNEPRDVDERDSRRKTPDRRDVLAKRAITEVRARACRRRVILDVAGHQCRVALRNEPRIRPRRHGWREHLQEDDQQDAKSGAPGPVHARTVHQRAAPSNNTRGNGTDGLVASLEDREQSTGLQSLEGSSRDGMSRSAYTSRAGENPVVSPLAV